MRDYRFGPRLRSKVGGTSSESADTVVDYAVGKKLKARWLFDTHVHADHVTAAAYLQDKLGGKNGIGDQIPIVQRAFAEIYNMTEGLAPDGGQFDILFADDAALSTAILKGRVMHTEGHTPACVTYNVGNAPFVGDTLFMPDYGSARVDFPGGEAS